MRNVQVITSQVWIQSHPVYQIFYLFLIRETLKGSWILGILFPKGIDAFELWCWRRPLKVPWTERRASHSILNEINPECSLERLMLNLSILWLSDAKSQLVGKDPDAGKDWGQEQKGMTEDELVGWHHWLNGPEFGQALGDRGGQGSLVCCSPWGCKESDTSEWLNNNNNFLQPILLTF